MKTPDRLRSSRATPTLVALALTASLAACGGGDDEPEEPASLSTQQVFERSKDATVQLAGRVGEGYGYGTGIVYDKRKGLIITNAHVVNGVTALTVRLGEEDPIPARILGSSFCNDLAVVELTDIPEGLDEFELGNSDQVRNQDEVTALGYPTTLSEDIETEDLVSSSGTVQSPDVQAAFDPGFPRFPNLIQHDATINPGNSGGPLLNDQAEVVGVNTLGAGEGVENQFYAISSNHVEEQLAELEQGNSPDDLGWDIQPFSQVFLSDVYPAAGFGTAAQGEQVDRFLASRGISGLWVWNSTAGKPAEEAALVSGDLITTINDTPVREVPEVCDILQSTTPGQTIEVEGIYITSGEADDYLTDWRTELKMPE